MSATEPPDGASDEFEPFKELEAEAERIVRHPHAEAQRLHLEAEEGESGATPFIEIGTVARWVIPFVALMVALILGVYFAARRWG
jgi:hypothetical protein